jgi:tRNA pseudouridine55 synthase
MEKTSGWLFIDKPANITSAKVVAKIKRLLRASKVGHAGTLDPFATGMLPIAIGSATRTIEYVIGKDKEYTFSVKFGMQTDTDDIEGQIIKESSVKINKSQIENMLPSFIGEIEQVPPRFSAIKVQGKRAYDLARNNQEVILKARKIKIYNFILSDYKPDENIAYFTINCSKGTYIRSIARDLGIKLGCFGHVFSLRRTRIGGFLEDSMISLEKLEELVHNAQSDNSYLLGVNSVLDDIPAFGIKEELAIDISNGKQVSLALSENEQQANGFVRIVHQNRLIALGFIKNGIFKPQKVFK